MGGRAAPAAIRHFPRLVVRPTDLLLSRGARLALHGHVSGFAWDCPDLPEPWGLGRAGRCGGAGVNDRPTGHTVWLSGGGATGAILRDREWSQAAGSGGATLDLLDREAEQIDLLLVDFAMPGMTGADVARAARAKHVRLPVLFVTGYADLAAMRGIGEDCHRPKSRSAMTSSPARRKGGLRTARRVLTRCVAAWSSDQSDPVRNQAMLPLAAALSLRTTIWVAAVGAILFLSAGTLNRAQAWVLLAEMGTCGLSLGLWLDHHARGIAAASPDSGLPLSSRLVFRAERPICRLATPRLTRRRGSFLYLPGFTEPRVRTERADADA